MYRDTEGNAAVLADMAIRFAALADMHDAETLRATIARLEDARGQLVRSPDHTDRVDAIFLQAAIDRLNCALTDTN